MWGSCPDGVVSCESFHNVARGCAALPHRSGCDEECVEDTSWDSYSIVRCANNKIKSQGPRDLTKSFKLEFPRIRDRQKQGREWGHFRGSKIVKKKTVGLCRGCRSWISSVFGQYCIPFIIFMLFSLFNSFPLIKPFFMWAHPAHMVILSSAMPVISL